MSKRDCFICKDTGRAQTFKRMGNTNQIAGFAKCSICHGTGIKVDCEHPIERQFRYWTYVNDDLSDPVVTVGCGTCGAVVPDAAKVLENWKTRKQPWFNSTMCPICNDTVRVLRHSRVNEPSVRILALAGHIKAMHPEILVEKD